MGYIFRIVIYCAWTEYKLYERRKPETNQKVTQPGKAEEFG